MTQVIDGTKEWISSEAPLDIKLPTAEEHLSDFDDPRQTKDTPTTQEQDAPPQEAQDAHEDAPGTTEDTSPGAEVKAPVGLNDEERQWFDSLDEAGKKTIARKYSEMDKLLTKKSQALGDLAQYASKPEVLDAVKYHQENPQALNLMRFIERDPILGPAVVKMINSYSEAYKAGKVQEWAPTGVFAPPPPAGPSLDKYLGKSADELQDLALSDPEFTPALLGEIGNLKRELASFKDRSSSLLQPIEAASHEAQQAKELSQHLDSVVATLPDDLVTASSNGQKRLTAEAATELNEVYEKHGPEWVKAGKTPQQALELAAEKVIANRKEAVARKEGEEKAKAEAARKRQQGLPQSGGPQRSGDESSLSKRISERIRADRGFDIP